MLKDYKSHMTVKYLVGINTFTGVLYMFHQDFLDELKPGQSKECYTNTIEVL